MLLKIVADTPQSDASGAGPGTIVGLMSGTSLDGITAAIVRFGRRESNRMSWELLHHHTRPYEPDERAQIVRVLDGGDVEAICRLDFQLGEWFARATLEALAAAGLSAADVHAIASHGQTVWHVPGEATLQLGEAAVIAERTGIPVVSDFRVRDVAAGGQGAPLVPIADALLFSSDTHWRALQNIGGIGNVTVVPPGGATQQVRAFDTGPGVVVINGVVEILTGGREVMDRDGAFSAGGTPVAQAVDEVMQTPYFLEPPPKSTGRELFSRAMITNFVRRCRDLKPDASDADIVSSAVELTARSISESYRRFVTEPIAEVLLAGGGSRHPGLVAALRTKLAPLPVRGFADVICDPEAREAIAFALLGELHLRGEPGNVPGATGARGTRILGVYTPA